jgi:hypothetical protein
MASDPYSNAREQLVAFFGSDRVSEKHLPDGRTIFRLSNVLLPKGCVPGTTAVVLVYSSPSGAPEVHVNPAIVLATGRVPRNMNPVTVDGEAVATFSANCPWNPGESVGLYVMRRLWRFKQPD